MSKGKFPKTENLGKDKEKHMRCFTLVILHVIVMQKPWLNTQQRYTQVESWSMDFLLSCSPVHIMGSLLRAVVVPGLTAPHSSTWKACEWGRTQVRQKIIWLFPFYSPEPDWPASLNMGKKWELWKHCLVLSCTNRSVFSYAKKKNEIK